MTTKIKLSRSILYFIYSKFILNSRESNEISVEGMSEKEIHDLQLVIDASPAIKDKPQFVKIVHPEQPPVNSIKSFVLPFSYSFKTMTREQYEDPNNGSLSVYRSYEDYLKFVDPNETTVLTELDVTQKFPAANILTYTKEVVTVLNSLDLPANTVIYSFTVPSGLSTDITLEALASFLDPNAETPTEMFMKAEIEFTNPVVNFTTVINPVVQEQLELLGYKLEAEPDYSKTFVIEEAVIPNLTATLSLKIGTQVTQSEYNQTNPKTPYATAMTFYQDSNTVLYNDEIPSDFEVVGVLNLVLDNASNLTQYKKYITSLVSNETQSVPFIRYTNENNVTTTITSRAARNIDLYNVSPVPFRLPVSTIKNGTFTVTPEIIERFAAAGVTITSTNVELDLEVKNYEAVTLEMTSEVLAGRSISETQYNTHFAESLNKTYPEYLELVGEAEQVDLGVGQKPAYHVPVNIDFTTIPYELPILTVKRVTEESKEALRAEDVSSRIALSHIDSDELNVQSTYSDLGEFFQITTTGDLVLETPLLREWESVLVNSSYSRPSTPRIKNSLSDLTNYVSSARKAIYTLADTSVSDVTYIPRVPSEIVRPEFVTNITYRQGSLVTEEEFNTAIAKDAYVTKYTYVDYLAMFDEQDQYVSELLNSYPAFTQYAVLPEVSAWVNHLGLDSTFDIKSDTGNTPVELITNANTPIEIRVDPSLPVSSITFDVQSASVSFGIQHLNPVINISEWTRG